MRKLLSLLVALALPAQSNGATATELPPAAAQSVSVNGQTNTIQRALSRIDQPVWRAGATRSEFGGYNFNITPGLRTGFTSRIREVSPLSGATYAIRLVYSGWQAGTSQAPGANGSSGEQPGDNPVTCTASIETNTAKSVLLGDAERRPDRLSIGHLRRRIFLDVAAEHAGLAH